MGHDIDKRQSLGLVLAFPSKKQGMHVHPLVPLGLIMVLGSWDTLVLLAQIY